MAEVDAKYAGTAYLLGLAVSIVMLVVYAFFDAIAVEIVWTDLLGIFLGLIITPIIFGTLIHGIDSLLQNQDFGDDREIWFWIWIIGVVVSFIMVGVTSLLSIFGLEASFTSFGGIVIMLVLVPWITGFVGRGIDDKLT